MRDARDLGLRAVRKGLLELGWAVELEIRRLYRLELQATLTTTSRLTADLAEDAGCRLDDLWPELPVPRRWLGPQSVLAPARADTDFWFVVADESDRRVRAPTLPQTVRRSGVLVRGADDERGALGFAVRRGVLEAVAAFGSAVLVSRGLVARLYLRDGIPETIATALPGRRLRDLVSHEVLDRRAYVVRACRKGPSGRGTVVSFHTALVELTLPWHAELAAAVGAHETDGSGQGEWRP